VGHRAFSELSYTYNSSSETQRQPELWGFLYQRNRETGTLFITWERQFERGIKWDIPRPRTEAEQALNGRDGAHSGNRSQSSINEGLREGLQVAQMYSGERLTYVRQEPFGIALVAAARVLTLLPLQPKLDDVGIA